jgi:hypothetical protein
MGPLPKDIEYVKNSSFSLRVRRFSCSLILKSGVGPSISSLAVSRSFFLPVCILVPVLVSYLCPSSVRVVATFNVKNSRNIYMAKYIQYVEKKNNKKVYIAKKKYMPILQ